MPPLSSAPRDPPPSREISTEATAHYIQAMSSELGGMAARAQLRMLHYLLDMVRLEAEQALKALAARKS